MRPKFAPTPDDGAIFLTVDGTAFSPGTLTQPARRYVNRAQLGKSGACHLFRHTMATLMLEGGADIRYIQAILGHVRLETTEIYTRVSIRQLDSDEDIILAFPINDGWLVVCETSLRLVDAAEKGRLELPDVVEETRWHGDQLLVRCADGSRTRVRVRDHRLEADPLSG